eukprot:scaffold539_cov359-Prasinococcus_capsulatus_cf.AAC.34
MRGRWWHTARRAMEARTDSSAPSRVSASSTNGCPSSSCGGAVAGVVAPLLGRCDLRPSLRCSRSVARVLRQGRWQTLRPPTHKAMLTSARETPHALRARRTASRLVAAAATESACIVVVAAAGGCVLWMHSARKQLPSCLAGLADSFT